jgi:hypothetical protein
MMEHPVHASLDDRTPFEFYYAFPEWIRDKGFDMAKLRSRLI